MTLCIRIAIAVTLLDSIIVRDKIPITNMPLVESTTFYATLCEEIVKYWKESQKN